MKNNNTQIKSTFENNLTPIEKLYTSISKMVDEETHYRFFKKICDEYDSKWNKDFKPEYWKNSQIRIILQVHERLILTDALNKDIDDEFLRRKMYPQLITYLRLTCFDQLGQPVNWMIFSDWLRSKNIRKNREKLIENIEAKDELELSEGLYKEYLKDYGVKNSFFNFIRNLIPNENRDKLLSQIKIDIDDFPAPISEGKEGIDIDKENYLYKIRNDYTHSTYSRSPIRDLNENEESEWLFRERFNKGKKSYWVTSHKDFEITLKEIVLIGIAEIIKKG